MTTTVPDHESAQHPVDGVLAKLEQLPSHPSAAARVLWVADDPNASVADLAAAVSADPALTARTMRMANSAYYGLSGRVASANFAVTMLGFSTIRSLAVASAAGVMGDEASVPDGFWQHAAATACASALLADRSRVARAEAFSVGLLHDVGEALLYQADPERTALAHAEAGGSDTLAAIEAERRILGIDHAAAAAKALESWKLPAHFVSAIAEHHNLEPWAPSPLHKCLVAGHALAALVGAADPVEFAELLEQNSEALALVGVDTDGVDNLVEQVQREAAGVAASLSG